MDRPLQASFSFPSYSADLSNTKVSEEDTNGQKGDGQQNNETADTMEPIAKKRYTLR